MKQYSLTQVVVGLCGQFTVVAQGRNSLGQFTSADVQKNAKVENLDTFLNNPLAGAGILVMHHMKNEKQTVACVSTRNKKGRIVSFRNDGSSVSEVKQII